MTVLPLPGRETRVQDELRVAWIGLRPDWFESLNGSEALDGVELDWTSLDSLRGRKSRADWKPSDLVHVPKSELKRLPLLREALPHSVVVLDLSGEGDGHLGWRSVREATRADVILVGSLWELRELRRRHPSLAGRTMLFRQPVDLCKYGAQATVAVEANGPFGGKPAVGHKVLFSGPYTEAGGLDMMLAAVHELRRRDYRVRLGAIPSQTVSPRFLARCRRHAARLGDQVLLAPSVAESELPLWYRSADVVCLPCRGPVGAESAKLAAASGKPFVGAEVEPLIEHVVDGETGFLLPVGDLGTFVSVLESILGDGEEARKFGAAARRRAENALSPTAAAERLRWIWNDALSRKRSPREVPRTRT